jgi:hypothetical protein
MISPVSKRQDRAIADPAFEDRSLDEDRASILLTPHRIDEIGSLDFFPVRRLSSEEG